MRRSRVSFLQGTAIFVSFRFYLLSISIRYLLIQETWLTGQNIFYADAKLQTWKMAYSEMGSIEPCFKVFNFIKILTVCGWNKMMPLPSTKNPFVLFSVVLHVFIQNQVITCMLTWFVIIVFWLYKYCNWNRSFFSCYRLKSNFVKTQLN